MRPVWVRGHFVCPYCEASLDPGERCDCCLDNKNENKKRRTKNGKRNQSAVRAAREVSFSS